MKLSHCEEQQLLSAVLQEAEERYCLKISSWIIAHKASLHRWLCLTLCELSIYKSKWSQHSFSGPPSSQKSFLMATCRKCSLTFLPTPKSFTTLQEKKAKQIKSSQTSSSLSGLTTSSPSLCSDFRGFMGLTLWLDAWRFAANRIKLFFYSKLSNLAWLPIHPFNEVAEAWPRIIFR